METLLTFLPGFLAAYAILLVGASSPGPAVAMIMGISLGQGRQAAVITSAGIACGSMTTNILTILGVGLLLSQVAWAMTALKYIGAAYLIYLAFGAFKKAVQPPQVTATASTGQPALALFLKGFALQATNPKSIAFWLAIASVGATTNAPLWIIVLFVAGSWCLSFSCHAAWALALSAHPVRSAYASARRHIEAALGAFFVFAAIKLAVSRI